MNCDGFNSSEIAGLFREFGLWLGAETGAQKAAITINKFYNFFVDLEHIWGMVPTYQVLLDRYGTPGLRQRELPMRFLTETSRITIDVIAKSEDATQRQISDLLSRLPAGTTVQKSLNEYYSYLTERQKNGKTALRSIRLALTAATGLLQEILNEDDRPPCQMDLDKYLHRIPGQRASISGYVGFLKRKGIAELKLPPKSSTEGNARKKAKKRLEHELTGLLMSGGTGKMYARKLIGAGLAYFHGLPKLSVAKISSIAIDGATDPGGVTCNVDGLPYWLPAEFVESCAAFHLQFSKAT